MTKAMRTAAEGVKMNNAGSELSLCWKCERAGRASCEWMQRGVPVKGWNAEPTMVYLTKKRRAHSFRVRECPKFIPLHERKVIMIERDW